jgi:hypothetical protein
LSPPQGNTLAADRTLTVDIPIPDSVSYAHTTFNDAHVYLVGLATTEELTIQFVKRGTSKLLDRNGKVWTFTHMDTDPKFRFGYHTDTCGPTVQVVAAKGGVALCDTNSV